MFGNGPRKMLTIRAAGLQTGKIPGRFHAARAVGAVGERGRLEVG